VDTVATKPLDFKDILDPIMVGFDVAVATHKTIDLVVQTRVKKLQRKTCR
jgi:hypothetical protein